VSSVRSTIRPPLATAAILATAWLAGPPLCAAPQTNPAGGKPLVELLAGHVYDRRVYTANGHITGRQILQFGTLEPQPNGKVQVPVVIEGFDAAGRRTSIYRLRLTCRPQATAMVMNFVSMPHAGTSRLAFQVSGSPLTYPIHSAAGTILPDAVFDIRIRSGLFSLLGARTRVRMSDRIVEDGDPRAPGSYRIESDIRATVYVIGLPLVHRYFESVETVLPGEGPIRQRMKFLDGGYAVIQAHGSDASSPK
jgi:hypothetical protein